MLLVLPLLYEIPLQPHETFSATVWDIVYCDIKLPLLKRNLLPPA
jgi:hypothetical protein